MKTHPTTDQRTWPGVPAKERDPTMATIQLQVVTPERIVLEDDVDIVVARGAEGDIGVLHGHEPTITPLATGELMYRVDGEERHMAVSGGFMEVRPDKVVVLADVA